MEKLNENLEFALKNMAESLDEIENEYLIGGEDNEEEI